MGLGVEQENQFLSHWYGSIRKGMEPSSHLPFTRRTPYHQANETVCTAHQSLTSTTTTATTRSTSVDPARLSFSSQPCHSSLPASSLWGPRCQPPGDRQINVRAAIIITVYTTISKSLMHALRTSVHDFLYTVDLLSGRFACPFVLLIF